MSFRNNVVSKIVLRLMFFSKLSLVHIKNVSGTNISGMSILWC